MSLGAVQVVDLMFRDDNFMYNVTTDVLPFTNYNFTVRACNVLGCGNVSQPSPTVMTLPDGKPALEGGKRRGRQKRDAISKMQLPYYMEKKTLWETPEFLIHAFPGHPSTVGNV